MNSQIISPQTTFGMIQKNIFILLIGLFSGVSLFAQIDYQCIEEAAQTNVTVSAGIWTFNNPISSVIDPSAGLFNTSTTTPGAKVNFSIKSVKAFVKIDFGDNHPFGNEDYTVDVTSLGLTGIYGLGSQSISIPTVYNSFSLNEENPEKVVTIDLGSAMAPTTLPTISDLIAIYFGGSNMFTISAQPSFDITSNDLSDQEIVNHLRVSVCYEVEYEVDAAAVTNPFKVPLPINPTQVSNTKRYNFSWSNFDNVLYPTYEIQILRLFNRKEHTPIKQEDIEAVIDWSRALSFVLPENTLTKNGAVYSKELTLSEFTGYYAWRIRAIGSAHEGGVANNRNWGDWDLRSETSLINQSIIDLSNISDIGGTNYAGSVFFFRDPDEFAERNTIYSRVFTEGGKTHEGMNYADGLLKSRQSQSYFPSNLEHKTVITQQFYDHVGRSAISTLPVPTQNQLSGYQEQFARESVTGNLYTVDDFDTGTKKDVPSKMSLKGAGINALDYYSDEGPDPYVDNAKGFPYSISRYSSDGLDNVEEQSGVGERHMIGDVANGMGRTTTKNYTSDVSLAELVRLFGAEAPDPNTVTKEVTRDPNGTESVSYIDKTGKLLATCLSLNTDLDFDEVPLDPLSTSGSSFSVKDMLRASEKTSEGFVSTKRILFTEENNLTIEYTPFGCDPISICGQSLYCDFEVTIMVSEINNPHVNLIPVGQNMQLSSTLCSNTIPYVVTLSNLPPGDYLVKKVLKPVDNHPLNSTSIQSFVSSQLATTEDALYTYNDLVTIILANLEEESDLAKFADAMDCVQAFVDGTLNQAGLETCLTSPQASAPLEFDMSPFDFNRLANIDLSIVTGFSLNTVVDPVRIDIIFEDCGFGASPLGINAGISLPEPPCLVNNGLYDYQGFSYDYPPFLEYFADAAWEDLTNIVIDQITAEKIQYNEDNPTQTPIPIIPTQLEVDGVLAIYANDIFPGYGISSTQISDYINNSTSINANDFNKMIWHMLNDEYYCGQLVWDDGGAGTNGVGYHKIDPLTGNINPNVFDPSTDSDVQAQYACQELWECWESNVEAITAILQLNVGDDVSPFDAIGDNEQDDADPTLGDHLATQMPWLLTLFLGDDPVAGLEDDIDDISSDDMTFDNLPALFLDCTGYRYARILDPRIVRDINNSDPLTNISFGGTLTDHEFEYNRYLTTTIIGAIQPHQLVSGATGSLPTVQFNTLDMPLWGSYVDPSNIPTTLVVDMTNITNSSQVSEIEEYFNKRSGTPIDTKAFPYTYNPVFAFKYYEYYYPASGLSQTQQNWITFNTGNIHSSFVPPSTFDAPSHFKTVEIEMGYPFEDIIQPNPAYCIELPGANEPAHDEWTCGRRSDFLEAIKNRQEFVIDPADLDDDDGRVPFVNGVLILADNDDCIDATDAYYLDPGTRNNPDYLNNPIANACKSACENRRNQFKSAIMAALEKRCYTIGGCTGCPGHISLEHIELLTDQLVGNCESQCSTLVEIGQEGPCSLLDGTVIQACDITYGTPCQKYQMEQIRSWIPEVDFPSLCSPDQYPTGHLKTVFDNQTPGDSDCNNTANDFTGQPNSTNTTSEVKEIQNP